MIKDSNYNKINEYYNKFTENKRLNRRHGIVEFETSMYFIKKYLKSGDKVIDIGCGTGRYSLELAQFGFDVTAVEYSAANYSVLKSNVNKLQDLTNDELRAGCVDTYNLDARKLSGIESNTYDLAIVFGPLYHLQSIEDKIAAVNEAKRVVKPGGIIMIAYIMNDYGVLYHAFIEGYYNEIKDELDENFRIREDESKLYAYAALADINEINDRCNLKSLERFSQEGPSDYIRPVLNKMDDETFEAYKKWHLLNCTRPELLGAGTHVVDISKNIK